MSTLETLPGEPIAEHGEPCRRCGAAMAGDQRYCLNCGNRRGGPRVDPLEFLGGSNGNGSVNGTANGASEVPPAAPKRDVSPLAAVGAVAALGAILLIGVLIGKGNSSTPTTAAAPQIVTVGGTAAPTDASGSTGADSSTAAATTVTSDWPSGKSGYTVELGTLPKSGTTATQVDAQKKQLESKGASGVGVLDTDNYGSLPAGNYILYSGVYTSKAEATKALGKLKSKFPSAKVVRVSKSSGSGKAAAAAAVPNATKVDSLTDPSTPKNAPVVASKKALKDFNNATGDAYEQAAKKLPKKIVTPGKPPPIDNKPPGGGSGGGITIK